MPAPGRRRPPTQRPGRFQPAQPETILKETKLLLEKKSLEERIIRIKQKQNDWLEPFQNWIKVALSLVKIARDNNLLEKKVVAKEIFGSNLLLQNKIVRANAPKILNLFGKMGAKKWDALRASHFLASSKPLSSILCHPKFADCERSMVPGRGLEPPRLVGTSS